MSTNEKIKARIEECNVWASLMDRIDYLRKDVSGDIARYRQQIADEELDNNCWQAEEIEKLKIKLAACDSVEAVILKAIG